MNKILTNKLNALKAENNNKLVCKLETISHEHSKEQKNLNFITPSENKLFKFKVFDFEEILKSYSWI